jgi:hypothetical protein
MLLIILAYVVFKNNFLNPRDFINYIKNTFTETFEPCIFDNKSYCGNMAFLPEFMRAGTIGSNSINDKGNVQLKLEDYQIDKRLKIGVKDITMNDIIVAVPVLLDYKTYLEKVVKFVLECKTDDNIQKDFLAKKLRYKMTRIFYNAYNTVTNKQYPLQTYNELLLSEREFSSTLDIFTFLSINELDSYNLQQLQKEFSELNNKLNQIVIDKVNEISPQDYDITTSRLPELNEPQAFNLYT